MRKRIFVIIFSIVLLFTLIIFRISTNYETTCNVFVENGIKGDLTKEANLIILDVITNTTDNFKKITYRTDGSVATIEINTTHINHLCNEIAVEIHKRIQDNQHIYNMPIGNTLKIPYFSGKGFDIAVELLPLGYVEYEINSALIEGGFNQTLHRISVDFFIKIRCILPFHKFDSEIKVPMIISETLIAGNIPEVLFTP